MHRSMLVSAYVNRCYLEKTELAWFRLQDLVSMERLSGKDDFRRNFLESVRSLEPQIKDLFDAPRHPESLEEEAVHA